MKAALPIRLFKDIRFWIIFFFIIRLYAITLPPLEVGHNWRQTDGMMVARNFYETSANIFYPRVDVAGDLTGIVGCEFPILNYSVYVMASVFGYDHWYGRLIVLLVSCFGVFYFHRGIRKYFGESAAFNAAIVLLVSLWFSYSRKFIPDVFSASLCIAAVYFATEYLDRGKVASLLLFFVLALTGCLSKILAAVILTVLVIPVLNKEIPLTRKVLLAAFSTVILGAVCWWYFLWVPYLNETYGLTGHFFMGMSFHDGFAAIAANWQKVASRFYDTPLKYTGFAAFVFSVFMVIRKRNGVALLVFIIPFLSFLVLLVKTGASIMGDHYYILTAIPSMAFITGVGLSYIQNTKIVAGILFVVAVEGIGNQYGDFRLRQPFIAMASLEPIMDSVSARTDLVVIDAEVDYPTAMYFAHRKGWVVPGDVISNKDALAGMMAKGCRYVVVLKELYGDLTLSYPIVYESQYFKIYRLSE